MENAYDTKLFRLNVAEYKKQMKTHLMTSRFNNETLRENSDFRSRHSNIGCIYAAPEPISQHIEVDAIVFVLEMNNDTNQIAGIGLIRNHYYCEKYRVYKNNNYNRYVYPGKQRIDRSEMSTRENAVMQIFDILCFTGNKHMKRGQGLKSFPCEILYKYKDQIDLVGFIGAMFKKRMMAVPKKSFDVQKI